MKLNWETIRRILAATEEMPGTAGQLDSDRVPGVFQDEAAYHMRLLIEAGLVEGGCRDAIGPEWCYVLRLKWQGHQLLDQIRRDTIWNKIKDQARDKGVDLTLENIATLARKAAEAMF